MAEVSIASMAPDNLMLFDGVCRFCSTSVRLALSMDTRHVLRFTPLQSPYGQALAAAHGLNPTNPDSFVFFDKGRARVRSDGALALAGRLPAPWSWLIALRLAPRATRDKAYDWLAANRYRLFGKYDSCMVPTPAQAKRFVTDIP
ncbi:MAG: thiol-disulfide oxidoreductase [Caulobacter sp.]|nr:thiol-disulfide oxidoreductase [Caulobacter sp.]